MLIREWGSIWTRQTLPDWLLSESNVHRETMHTYQCISSSRAHRISAPKVHSTVHCPFFLFISISSCFSFFFYSDDAWQLHQWWWWWWWCWQHCCQQYLLHSENTKPTIEEQKKEIGDGEKSKEIGRLCKCIFEIDCLIEVATVDFFSQVVLSRDSLLLLIFASLSWTVVTKRNWKK